MDPKLKEALKAPVKAEVDDDDEEVSVKEAILQLARSFFWRSNRYRAGAMPAPAGMTLEDLPKGATINGKPNPKYAKKD